MQCFDKKFTKIMSSTQFNDINKIDFPQQVTEIFAPIVLENVEQLSDECKLFVQTDMDGIIQYANDTYKDYFGRGEKSIINHSVYDFDDPATPKAILQHVGEYVAKDDDVNAIFINKSLSGKYVITYAEVDVIKDRHGEHIHIFTRKKKIPNHNIFNVIIPFYKFLLKKEVEEGQEAAYQYISDFISRNGFNDFNELIDFLAYGE